MKEPAHIWLRDRRTGNAVAALIDALDAVEVQNAVATWKPVIEERIQQWIAAGVPRSQWPEHHHWNWERKFAHYHGLLAYQFLGIECEGEVQGLMLVATEGHACRLPEQFGRPLVYVNYLSTAPWNDPSYSDAPRFGLVGSVLIAAAVQVSLESGFRGRLGLHALPQAEVFYREYCGMTDLGADASDYDLHYFEMTPEQANDFLNS